MSNLNEQYIFQAKEILKLITSTGQEAYIVGESLRDLVLNQEIKEVEIFTSLGKENLLKLFDSEQIIGVEENCIHLHHLGFSFTISLSSHYTFGPKVKVKTPRRHYSTSLMDFLETKIYSVNTLAMANNNVIYDCFNGRQDIFRKRIRMICDNPQSIFLNDPIKMLEAIRLVSELGFRLDKGVFKAIKRRRKAILKVDLTNVTKEMMRIISGKYSKKAIKLLVKSKLYKRLPLFKYEIKKLYERFRKLDPKIFVCASLVKNKGYNEKVALAFDNPVEIAKIVDTALAWPKSNYDVTTLFNQPLECLLQANQVNYILARAKNKQRQITKLYNRLVIKSIEDLAFKKEDLLKLTIRLTDEEVEEMLRDISNKVLHKKLKNNYEIIKEYVIRELNQKMQSESNLDSSNANQNNESEELNLEDDNPKDNNYNLDREYQNGLFTDSDFVNQEEQIKEEITPRQEFNNASVEFEMLRRQQIELDRRVSELELQHLEKELNDEIEKKIKQSGLLDGLVGSYRESTYNTLRKVYYDVLIKTEKYQRLESKGDNFGQN